MHNAYAVKAFDAYREVAFPAAICMHSSWFREEAEMNEQEKANHDDTNGDAASP